VRCKRVLQGKYEYKTDKCIVNYQKMLVKLAESNLKTLYGNYHEVLYYDGKQEINVLKMGVLQEAEDVLVRIHSSCIYGHHFNSIECDCREQLALAQQRINAAGRGVIIWLEQEGKGNGHYALMLSKEHKAKGMSQGDAYQAVGFQQDARDFSRAAEILQDLGIASVRMLTDNVKKMEEMERFGIKVVGIEQL
jgi:GTP cyclohydrolase II